MNNNVEIKKDGIFVSLSADIIQDLEHTAELRGLEFSELVNSLITDAIDEEKENHPQVFERDIEVNDARLVYADGSGTVDASEIVE